MALTLAAQILSQWSGTGSITLYAPDQFHLLGIPDTNTTLLIDRRLSASSSFVAAVICALFLVDFIGRKRSLLLGIACQAVAMIYVAAFLTAVPQLGSTPRPRARSRARSWRASRVAVAMIYLSGFGWALGWNSMQYLLTAELFPLRIRAFCTSLAMTFHFANQYGNSEGCAEPVTCRGRWQDIAAGNVLVLRCRDGRGRVLGVVYRAGDEAGRSLESMDRLFSLPWYMIGEVRKPGGRGGKRIA